MPKERTQARTSRSDPAFVEEYGLDGVYGLCGENLVGSSSSRTPYTSSVEMWGSRTPRLPTPSSRVYVPMMLVCRNGDGSRRELSLWLSAAKWTTTSQRPTSSSTSAASATEPWTN